MAQLSHSYMGMASAFTDAELEIEFISRQRHHWAWSRGTQQAPGCLQGNLGIAQLEDVAETAGHVASASDTDSESHSGRITENESCSGSLCLPESECDQ